MHCEGGGARGHVERGRKKKIFDKPLALLAFSWQAQVYYRHGGLLEEEGISYGMALVTHHPVVWIS